MKRLFKLWGVCTAIMLCGVLVAGCGGGGGGGGGGSSDSPTVSDPAPTVVYTTPVNNATDVGTASKITVTFSEAMNAASVVADNSFQINGANVSLSGISYDSTNKIATITPPAALGAGQTYTVRVNAVVQDTSGKAMQSAYTWTFTTGATVGVAPQLASKAPVAGAINVGTNTAIAMSFTKPMDINTFNSSAFTLQKTSDASTVAGTFSIIGQVVIFTPSAPLTASTQYTATVTTQAKDTSGIALAAPAPWSFTTGSGADATPPEVVKVGDVWQVSPTGTVADLRPPMSIAFNEPVYPFLFGTIDGKPVEVTFDYSPAGTTTVTMTPTADRAPGTYTTGVAVSDLAHNKSYTYTWSFTIVAP